MKNLFLFLLSILAITQLSAQPQAQKVAITAGNEALSWNETVHDFGTTPINEAVSTIFEVSNHSDKVLIIQSVKASCGCTAPSYDQEPVLPGETSQITAKYNAKKAGKYEKTVKVFTNLSESPVVLTLKGEIIEEY